MATVDFDERNLTVRLWVLQKIIVIASTIAQAANIQVMKLNESIILFLSQLNGKILGAQNKQSAVLYSDKNVHYTKTF